MVVAAADVPDARDAEVNSYTIFEFRNGILKIKEDILCQK